MHTVRLRVNGTDEVRTVDGRVLLSDFLRSDLGLTGTHVGCEHGVCGCCTVIMDGTAVRSCLLFAVQADASEILTIEGLAQNGSLHPVQEAFRTAHALQCGFCTPGFVLAVHAFLSENKKSEYTDDEIREALAGNLCRCTGYQHIVDAVRLAATAMATG